MEPAAHGMWQEFARTRSAEVKRRLVLHYLDLVRYVVSKFGITTHGGSHGLEQGDIMQYGVLGLVNAIDRFSPAVGVKFETYAVPRIRGAILDELRSLDWVPRSVRENTRRLVEARRQVSQEHGREALDLEIAGKLEMTPEEYQRFLSENGRTVHVVERAGGGEDGEDLLAAFPESGPDPFERLSEEQVRSHLVDAVGMLPAREQTVIALYYYEGLKFGDIARVLRVSESRVSQIHSDVLRRLREELQDLR